MGLLQFTKQGIYCERADVYIDPVRSVNKALITHGHADHARSGHKHYLCHKDSAPILKLRLGKKIQVESYGYNDLIQINGVRFSFHPAGHIVGSAQIRVEHKGEIWVVTGDYKLENDGVCIPYEPVKCHHFITECTFGLPIYQWRPQEKVFDEINRWWHQNQQLNQTSVLFGYSLGKAQRLLQNVDESIGPIFTHNTVFKVNETLIEHGISIRSTKSIDRVKDTKNLRKALIIAPQASMDVPWMRKLQPCSVAFASGWMGIRSSRRNRSAGRGFVLSDHADWEELNLAIKESEAEHVIAMHGYTDSFAKWLNENGINATTEKSMIENQQQESDGLSNHSHDTSASKSA
ncbi:ligase-associated DNA damage response exonuclease [Fulvivirgaceae bacterium BMA10]|uniref:Ligase-associated DNA damage response exonuclease n=1 Tax=Splendidivirga corallicola TaxID=3051826 RepID=A0ABT8KXY2_9BACT|nr:ligase-associated DNA damage response exonuclease [Fulvivirgaceae bacterium BMA10]